MKLFKREEKQCPRKIASLLQCNNFKIDIIQDEWKNVTSCSELVRDDFSQLLKNERLLRTVVRKEERGNVGESTSRRKKAVEVLKRQIKICQK